jgi:hypothetical protein
MLSDGQPSCTRAIRALGPLERIFFGPRIGITAVEGGKKEVDHLARDLALAEHDVICPERLEVSDFGIGMGARDDVDVRLALRAFSSRLLASNGFAMALIRHLASARLAALSRLRCPAFPQIASMPSARSFSAVVLSSSITRRERHAL